MFEFKFEFWDYKNRTNFYKFVNFDINLINIINFNIIVFKNRKNLKIAQSYNIL